jgi:D-3-phosphoglycerate dehydrogenase
MKILFIDTCHMFLINSLKADGHEVIEGYNYSYEEVSKTLMDVHGVVIRSRFKLDKTLLDYSEKLLFIARAGAGMESIDIDYAKNKNIICLNSPEGNRDAVGEHAIGMLLSLMNNLNRADTQIRNGEWVREANRGHELQGKTVGIIGFGNMGSAFAEKLKGFNCRIFAYDKYRKNFGNDTVKESTLEEIFDHSDIVSIHVPLTAETEFFIDDNFIKKFSKNIYLINTARGKCLKTDDLVSNLKSGKISGACLDVVEYEDLSFEKFSADNFIDNPSWQYLIKSDHVILSPHIAGWTYESLEKIAKVLYGKICSTINMNTSNIRD